MIKMKIIEKIRLVINEMFQNANRIIFETAVDNCIKVEHIK